MILFYWLLEHDRAARTRAVWWLPVLMALWTNLHGGFVAGLMLVGAYGAGEVISAAIEGEPGVRARAWASARRYGWIGAACAAASLVNPYGWNLHVHIAKYLVDSSIQSGIQEFMPYSFQDPMANYVEAMMLVAGAAAVWNAYHRRFVYAILLVLWGHAGLFSGASLPDLRDRGGADPGGLPDGAGRSDGRGERGGMAAPDGAGSGGVQRGDRSGSSGSAGCRCGSRFRLLALAGLFWLQAGPKFEARFDPKRFPVKAAEMLGGPEYASGVFTTDQWGDYLIYRHYPNVKVFIDGRSDFYGEKFGDRYLDVIESKWNWEKPLDEYRVRTVLLPTNASVASVLKGSSHWRVVYDDHVAIVFERVAGGQQAAGALPQGTTIPAVTDGGHTRDRAIANTQTRDLRITILREEKLKC